MQVPGRAFLGGAGGRRKAQVFLWGTCRLRASLQSEADAMAVKGDIIPRGVWAGPGDGVRGRATAEQRVDLRMFSISCRC